MGNLYGKNTRVELRTSSCGKEFTLDRFNSGIMNPFGDLLRREFYEFYKNKAILVRKYTNKGRKEGKLDFVFYGKNGKKRNYLIGFLGDYFKSKKNRGPIAGLLIVWERQGIGLYF